MSEQTARLRFALLLSGKSLMPWQLSCVEQLRQVAELVCVVRQPASPPPRSRSMLMRRYLERVESPARDAAAELRDVPFISAAPAVDFILKLGPGPIPTRAEHASRLGIWYFEHESEAGPPPFLCEVCDGVDVTRAALLALGRDRSEAVVLEEGHFRTDKRSYAANRDRVVAGIAPWPARVCGRLQAGAAAGAASRDPDPDPERGPERGSRVGERSPQLGRLLAETGRHRLELAWQRLFRHPQWNIGVLNRSAAELLGPDADLDRSIEWLPLEDRENFFADPFGIVRDGTLHVLCEQFGYREGRGHICAVDYAGGSPAEPRPAITLPVHMSYPFVLEDGGEIYCIPETAGAGEVVLFRAIEFPHRWEKAAVLIERFAGVDPTVFRHQGRWWLMCTEQGPHEDVELLAWYASDLLGPWLPHAGNPVKSDIRGARPAGPPFVHEGVLYRPAQDCSKRYGWRVVVQRVTALTPTAFREQTVKVIEAQADSPFPAGRHTLTRVGDVVLVDGLREVFVWPAFRAFLAIWARDLAARARR